MTLIGNIATQISGIAEVLMGPGWGISRAGPGVQGEAAGSIQDIPNFFKYMEDKVTAFLGL